MRREHILLLLILLLGAALRLTGLTRGHAEYSPPGGEHYAAFHTFHPDEETLLRAALALHSTTDPPLTAYGVFPMLAARAALGVVGLFFSDEISFDEAAMRPVLFVIVRLLAIAFSIASLVVVWWIGKAHFKLRVGLWAALAVACAPLAIQQAHFYTVDGVFVFLSIAALACGLQALSTERRSWYLACGLYIGLATATRLNGALCGVALAVVYAMKDGPNAVLARLRRADLWLAGLVAMIVLLSLQPYLLFNSELMQHAQSSDDFAYSLQVARGQVLKPWTLFDLYTTPYLHYWTQLWPQAVGWPMTCALLVGMGYALWRRCWPHALLLLWSVFYFASIGPLHTKHVRYLLPLLPALALLASAAGEALRRRWRWPALALLAWVLGYTAAYGVAFARIYAVDDSRLQSARWLYANAPAGSRIAVENGGFSTGAFVGRAAYSKSYINSSRIFGTRGYLLCEARRQYLYSRVSGADYIWIVDANRYVQYTAAPDRYPVLSEFYARLLRGELGFTPVRRDKVDPAWGRWKFVGEGAEPSFYGFDHPGVWVLQRTEDLAADWQRWQREMELDERCADDALKALSVEWRSGARSEQWAARAAALEQRYPDMLLTALIKAGIYQQMGDKEGVESSMLNYDRGYIQTELMAQYIPWASATSLLLLDLPTLAIMALKDGVDKRAFMRPYQKVQLADSYASIARHLGSGGWDEMASEVYRLAAQVDPRAEFYNALAAQAFLRESQREALEWWLASLELDATQQPIYKLAGKTAFSMGDYAVGLALLGAAAALDPQLSNEQKRTDLNLLLSEARRLGLAKEAAELDQRISELRVQHADEGAAPKRLRDE